MGRLNQLAAKLLSNNHAFRAIILALIGYMTYLSSRLDVRTNIWQQPSSSFHAVAAKLAGDGMRGPSLPTPAVKEFTCDRDPTVPPGDNPDWWRRIQIPAKPWTPNVEAKSLRWLSAGDTFEQVVSMTELHRFTTERASMLELFEPALEVPDVQHLHTMSPAVVWTGEKYVVFLRVSNYPDELYDNFVWLQEFTADMKVIPKSGEVLGIPTHSANLMAPGPEDPRAIICKQQLLVTFNLQFRNNDRRMMLYSYETKRLVLLRVQGLAFQRAEKNWMPFVHNDQLHFIYQLDPLVVLQCELNGDCICIVPLGGCNGEAHNTRKALARGGSGMTKIADHLYFGMIHSTFGDHAIRGHMLFFSTQPMGVVAVSSAIPLPQSLTACYTNTVPWDVQFPSSITLLGNELDKVLVGVHVRDAMSSLLVMDLKTTLSSLLAQNAGLCKQKDAASKNCTQWNVLGDGQVDATLSKGLE